MDKEQFAIRNEILYELKRNEWDKEILPHYGLTCDWKPRYDKLSQLVKAYLNSEHSKLET